MSTTCDSFGDTEVIRPTQEHLATVVWLHGLGFNGSDAKRHMETHLPLPNVKFILPTAPKRIVEAMGNIKFTAWFRYKDREDGPSNWEDVEESAAYVAGLLSSEPPGIPIVIAGFSMGACVALQSAVHYAVGRFPSGHTYPPINLKAVVCLSGAFYGPCRIGGSSDSIMRAASLPILICHSVLDDIVDFRLAEQSVNVMTSAGFQWIEMRAIGEEFGMKHYPNAPAYAEVRDFLISTIGLPPQP